MQDLLTVVVATYNRPDLLLWCLRTLANYAPFPYKLKVVCCADDQEILEQCDDVVGRLDEVDRKIIFTGRNLKAMGCFNLALKECDTPYIAFLHDDASFIPNSGHFWPNLIEVVSNEEVGMCGPAISNCVGLQHYLRWDLPLRCRVWYLYGACMMFRTDVISDLGGMDEDISPSDDVELSVRMNKEGYKIIVDRSCFIQHERHQTYSSTRPGDDIIPLEESFNKIIRKHGVAATVEPWYHETEWGIAQIVSPTFGEFMKRLEGGAPVWQA
jgi:GT2 family glycosyltransferase